mmetsp:Transcript_40770/g.75819  ORF Transcript_40770/g.75819 Transcript_40770/m.75819 type:complete len:85 (-) Transcript_40770:1501-1755(-)
MESLRRSKTDGRPLHSHKELESEHFNTRLPWNLVKKCKSTRRQEREDRLGAFLFPRQIDFVEEGTMETTKTLEGMHQDHLSLDE